MALSGIGTLGGRRRPYRAALPGAGHGRRRRSREPSRADDDGPVADPHPSPAGAGTRPTFTITDAATACAVSRKTITRKLADLAEHGAAKDEDGVWRIPGRGVAGGRPASGPVLSSTRPRPARLRSRASAATLSGSCLTGGAARRRPSAQVQAPTSVTISARPLGRPAAPAGPRRGRGRRACPGAGGRPAGPAGAHRGAAVPGRRIRRPQVARLHPGAGRRSRAWSGCPTCPTGSWLGHGLRRARTARVDTGAAQGARPRPGAAPP